MERGNEKDPLELLLEDLLKEAKLQNNFTVSLDADRLFTALMDASFLATLDVVLYDELAPGASSTSRITVPDGYYYIQFKYTFDVSIPWYMYGLATFALGPVMLSPAMPGHVEAEGVGYYPLKDWVEFTGLNTHPTENNRYHVHARFAVVTTETYDMIKRVFLDPINKYIRDNAKVLSGVPY